MASHSEQSQTIGLRFSERMSGYLAQGEADFAEGERAGKNQSAFLSFEVIISIKDVKDFCKLTGRKGRLEGTVSYKPLGQNLPIRHGEFTLFRPDRETGKRHMAYSFGFTGNDGSDYFLYGYKVIFDDPGEFDPLADMTTLFTRIYKGHSQDEPPFGAGILRFQLASLPSMLNSFEVIPVQSLMKKLKTISKFFKFCYGEIRDTYLARLSPIYHTEYENLVLNGRLKSKNGTGQNFFFFSGIHDKDFPFGDEGIFWDIALIIQKADGSWAKYALTDQIIEGLELDVEKGLYRYKGPVYQLLEGYQLSRSELKKSVLPAHLREIQAVIEIHFSCEKYNPVYLPFPSIPGVNELVLQQSLDDPQKWLSHLNLLGLHLTPHRVRPLKGTIILQDESIKEEYTLLAEQTLGEAEKSTLKNIRWPKLHYNYICGLNPEADDIYVIIRTDVLRKNRKDFGDRIQEALGKMVSHLVSLDLNIHKGDCTRLAADKAKPFKKVENNLLEINNDHLPAAVLQRRIISLQDEAGNLFYALEESTDPLNLGNINSDKVVKVAAIKDSNKFHALDDVLEKTSFFGKLETARQKTGKSKEAFSIIVKPNFMFMYSRKDPSTFTDPELVEHLMDRIYERGYRHLACAEARSTYGVFFTNREVKTVARHIGLSGKNYRVIDLSEDLDNFSFSGNLGDHYVNREWKLADFRIAFAKNKTHSYSFYTLTIKDIYGALPRENKFLEYHHKRDIYNTTIEFIKHFPVHYALIDAHISADGPFGIFADKNPNVTQTIIGSEDLVATDWIGAAKMGLDPMVSDYMKKAVEAFGKPQIEFVGDRSLYADWVNVTDVIPLLAFGALDRNYYFGNLFYSVFAYMEDFFQYKDAGVGRRIARILADPVKSLFFQKAGQGELDRQLNRKLFEMFKGME
ncbi:MAG: DUF362 domain-containing protein [Thermodesulfobacteriota bacterium]|nr:DUF362 domain-containing protein [Thermodesulfobacteriota bacterium]